MAKAKSIAELLALRTQDQKLAQEVLDALVKIADDALSAAELHADIYGLEFDHSPEYGMGGTYYGKTFGLANDGSEDEEGWTPSDTGWQSSSSSC